SDETLRCAADLGIAFFAYSPLGGPGAAATVAERLPDLAALARERGVSVQRLALRGVLSLAPVASVVVGAGRTETARDAALVGATPWDAQCEAALAHDRGRSTSPA